MQSSNISPHSAEGQPQQQPPPVSQPATQAVVPMDVSSPTTTTTTSAPTQQPQQLQLTSTSLPLSLTPNQIQTSTQQTCSIATTPTVVSQLPQGTHAVSAGPTALVIIPQHSTTTTANHIKAVTKVSAPISTTVGGVTAAHLTLAATTQSTPIQLQAPITTHVSNITPIALTQAQQQSTTPIALTPAHQQPAAPIALTPAHQQSAAPIANRPPSTLPVVPITRGPVTMKSEQNKYTCCLLDNGIRCERAAGNASFSARIQKIVGTKKLNFALDPTVRHAYICEHHKAIITVAKKTQTALARESKANAMNFAANNNQNTLVTQPIGKYNDLSRQQQVQLQHPVNLEMLNNQSRLANNHTGALNNISVRPGTQIAYSQYQGANPNQVAPMDMMMSSSYDNTGGDTFTPSSSSGVDVDLQQLQVNTLRRYKRHFRVQTKPGLNKLQLAESLKDHFRTLPIIEKEAITYFVYIVKVGRNKLDMV